MTELNKTRLGFRVDSVDAALRALQAQGGQVVAPPKDSRGGVARCFATWTGIR